MTSKPAPQNPRRAVRHAARGPRHAKPPLAVLAAISGGLVLVVAAIVGARLSCRPSLPPTPPPPARPSSQPIQTLVPPSGATQASQVIDGYVAAALAYKQRGHLDRAIAILQDVLRQNPGSSSPSIIRAHEALAWVYQKKGRKADALYEFRIVLRLAAPGSAEYREAEWGVRLLTRGATPAPNRGR